MRVAKSEDELLRASELAQYARQVRFQPQEWLEGDALPITDVFTDFTSCGYPFKMGESYLVVAFQTPGTGRWWTGACTRTQPLADAGQDLRALRAWKGGHPLARRTYGVIRRWTNEAAQTTRAVPDVPIALVHGDTRLEIKSDDQGKFEFDNLSSTEYRLEVGVPGWLGEAKTVNLRYDRCYEAEIYVEQKRESTGYTIYRNGALRVPVKVPTLPEPPCIEPVPLSDLPAIYERRNAVGPP